MGKNHSLPANKSGRFTIADVAREAGVSKTSVSRYLGGERPLLTDRLRERIEAAIARLGYRPSQMARGLKRGQTRLIGMIVADILNPYSVAVLNGVEAACQKHGYTLMLCNTANSEEREAQSIEALLSYSAEGLIIHTQGRDVQQVRELAKDGLPLVLIDRKLDDFECDLVGLDNQQAAREATLHLIAQGFEVIAFITESLRGVSARQERQSGFRLSLMENPDYHGQVVELSLKDSTALDQAIQDFLAAEPGRRKALFAVNGVMTLQIALALHRLGLKSPDDVGLLGFDELEWSALVGPGITTIAQPTYDIGFAAFECLLKRIGDDRSAPRQILLRGRLITRGSTQACAK